ncbi:E3 ubiquitin-protein ligase MARCHF3-like [Montipora foliosa]|uniref:E3 ubiquitin-protein ligase MARCHF3-like n=1 Tax=Montipora foliosa TaxID=591990 RepID=UPI0035F200CF
MELHDFPSEDSFKIVESNHRDLSLSNECFRSPPGDGITPTCRICQTSRSSEDINAGEVLVNPCNCKGTLAFVHKSCMERWLNLRNQDNCELCHFKFKTKRKFKPLHKLQLGHALTLLSSDEKGILMLGLVNLLLVLLEVPFLYYVIRISNDYFMGTFDGVDINAETNSEIYSLLLALLLLFTLILFASSLTFTVCGLKVFCKLVNFSREIKLIIPIRPLEETLDAVV